MERHLSAKEIEMLAEYQLTGEVFVAALLHLENCERCRKRLPTPGEAELARRLLADEPPPPNKIKWSTRSKLCSRILKRKWKGWSSRIKDILFKDNANCRL